MTRKIMGAIVFSVVVSFTLSARSETKPAFGISFSGYVKTDLIYDTRQTVSLREGHFLLFPKGEALDRDGKDTNAAPSFHILSIQTRIAGATTGPDAFGAKTSGLIEAEFFGHSEGDINGFRLRHAYAKLAWERTELLVGQFWHAMFITDAFPGVVSFNTGAPFQPFSRAPQVRLTHQIGNWSIIATALAQRDFTSIGPEGPSSVYARNAVAPELNLKAQYATLDGTGRRELLLGVGGDFKKIRPRLATESGYRTDASLSDFAGMAYIKVKTSLATIKAEAVYGENLHHLTMPGGYAVRETTDETKNIVSYASFRNLALWGEVHTNGEKVQAGLFVGYAKNLGAGAEIDGPAYARGFNIDALYRIAPRAVFNAGKLRLAAEAEWTAAAYGTPDAEGAVKDTKLVHNMRLLGAVFCFF